MKLSPTIGLFLILVLCFSSLIVAQTPATCDQLRSKIQQMERMDQNVMSPSLQKVHKEAMLKLYTQLGQCVEQEITIATEMRNAVAGTDAVPPVESKLRALAKEEAETKDKINALSTALNLPEVFPPAAARTTQLGSDPSTEQAETPPQNAERSAAGTTVLSTQPFVCLDGQPYADAPPLLADIVTKGADGVVQGDFGGALSGVPQMVLYATLDAASPTSSKLLRGLEPYQYLSETARTDKQLGGSATSNGAVSAIEKPGFARLLGFAVEHGAISKKNDGTNLTLSTSLYSLYTLNRKDTAETYAQAGMLNRIGVFATFAVDNQNSDLTNVRRSNLSEWSVKARLFGDRSTRSAIFTKFWKDKITPLIDARLEAVGKPLNDLTSSPDNADFLRLRTQVERCLKSAVNERKEQADYKAAATTDAERKKMLTDLLLSRLQTNVYDRIKGGQVKLSERTIIAIETQYVPNLSTALDNLKAAGGLIQQKLDELKKGPLATFAYTNHRQPNASDYSETKFLYEQEKGFMGPLKLTGNFGLSFYNKPDPSLKQQKLRDVSAALSFEGSTRSPFTEVENQSKITYSFVGRYERLFENRRIAQRKPDIGTFQFVMEIPFFRGLSLPLSASYANTEEEKKKHFRFNFGMRLDTDKLFELLKAGASR